MTRTEILERRGIIDSPHLIVGAVKLDIWCVRFSAEGTLATAIDATSALKWAKNWSRSARNNWRGRLNGLRKEPFPREQNYMSGFSRIKDTWSGTEIYDL
jgi:hypothetical protein